MKHKIYSPTDAISSWKDSLSLALEEIGKDGSVSKPGLRIPQLGAYYRVLSHWTISSEHGIIVLPTGVGKTDTMIAIMVGCLCEKILVVVPSKALRDQIGERFKKLGILPDLDQIKKTAKPPIVKILRKVFKNLDDIDTACESINVMICTASIFSKFPVGHLERLSSNFSHLFLDEAHHTQAPKTWARIQQAFKSKKALLFTATPFRNDEKVLSGEQLYNYPLSKAQSEKYFTKIEQHPISSYDPETADDEIAAKAIELLEKDLPTFPRHLIMARANNISKAEKLYELYKTKYSKYNPVLVHSNIPERERKANQALFESGQSKIAVCVDMFGEGYDLPQIKIGAFHDMRRNITTALQLIGRFTRQKKDLGTAKFVYNTEEENSSREILQLISDDSDWNTIIPNISEGKNRKQQDLEKFVKTFDLPIKIPLKALRPAFSVAVYETKIDLWTPENYVSFFNEKKFVSIKDISNKRDTLIIVAAEKVPLDWVKGMEYYNVEHHLYVLHWIKTKRLLVIHSSKTGNHYFKELARCLLGDNINLVQGEDVYRSLHDIERIKFHSLGLAEPGTDITFTQRSGPNVTKGTTVTELFNRTKQVLQGTGYKLGEYQNFGVTSKGRIWSFRRDNVVELLKWAQQVASKIVDSTIKTDQLVKHVSLIKILSVRPDVRPLTMEWPDRIYNESLSFYLIDANDHVSYIIDCSLHLHDPNTSGEIKFKVVSERWEQSYTFSYDSNGRFKIKLISGPRIFIDKLKRTTLEGWFNEHPPTIYFVDGSYLLYGNQHTILGQNPKRFDSHKIDSIDWLGNKVDITSESEGIDRSQTDSIQFYLINELIKNNYLLVFNDDDKDETADIVAISVDDANYQILVDFFHCKYSNDAKPGCRLKDFYELLGQAQKNTRWLDNGTRFMEQLVVREKRSNKVGQSRLRKGSIQDLTVLAKKAKNEYSIILKVFAVQPGLSKAKFESKAEDAVALQILFAATEDYIKATKQGAFNVICSP